MSGWRGGLLKPPGLYEEGLLFPNNFMIDDVLLFPKTPRGASIILKEIRNWVCLLSWAFHQTFLSLLNATFALPSLPMMFCSVPNDKNNNNNNNNKTLFLQNLFVLTIPPDVLTTTRKYTKLNVLFSVIDPSNVWKSQLYWDCVTKTGQSESDCSK